MPWPLDLTFSSLVKSYYWEGETVSVVGKASPGTPYAAWPRLTCTFTGSRRRAFRPPQRAASIKLRSHSPHSTFHWAHLRLKATAGRLITTSTIKGAHKSPVTNALVPYRQAHLPAIVNPMSKQVLPSLPAVRRAWQRWWWAGLEVVCSAASLTTDANTFLKVHKMSHCHEHYGKEMFLRILWTCSEAKKISAVSS